MKFATGALSTGAAATVTVFVTELVSPALSVTVSVMLLSPPVEYDALAVTPVAVLGLAPGIDQAYWTIPPSSVGELPSSEHEYPGYRHSHRRPCGVCIRSVQRNGSLIDSIQSPHRRRLRNCHLNPGVTLYQRYIRMPAHALDLGWRQVG
ncbi:MAG: hypothetical protein M3Q09_01210 [Gemmatimonadota bacterium]|nr:hypothetical protein [Gemmatimonadota bacterium]